MDICQIIQRQHDEQRTLFSYLEEWDRTDTEGLGAVWKRLAILLETHAEAEEKYFYPHLLTLGTGGADAEDAAEEVDDAIDDHNSIREGIRRAEAAEGITPRDKDPQEYVEEHSGGTPKDSDRAGNAPDESLKASETEG